MVCGTCNYKKCHMVRHACEIKECSNNMHRHEQYLYLSPCKYVFCHKDFTSS